MVNKQSFNNAIDLDFNMVRGDTLCFNFQLAGFGSREEYESLNVTFSVAEHYDDTPLIENNIDTGITLEEYDTETDTATFSVSLQPDQTKSMELARYYYDLQIKDSTNVITLMRGRLTLVWDVAD